MKKSKVTRSLLAAMSIVALTAVMYGCTHSSDDPPSTGDGMEEPDPAIAERKAIKDAIAAASDAVGDVNNMSTAAEVSAADSAITAARSAISSAANVPANETAANTGTVDALVAQLSTAKKARTAYLDKTKSDADKAMMAKAKKLHAGISASGGTGANTRTAAYGSGNNANDIAVTIGEAEAVNLSEDKKTAVAANHGWTGKRYAAEPTGGGTYEAVVYSNVGKPTQGKKFASTAIVTGDGAYQYQLNATSVGGSNTELSIDTSATGVAARVASPSFDQSAGKKEFEKGDNETRVIISGSYHGVSGTFRCTPNANETCSASVATEGFTLANGTWTFKASNNEARVMSVDDIIYASYGWWLHTEADGDLVASAFVSNKGVVPGAANLDTLQGTATYMGGAAGKYALYSTTGGTNDAGHFTARAMLEADFSDNSITGTIDMFMGADGKSRDWSVELKEAAVASEGAITRTGTGEADNDTVWTIGGTAADASGEWSGSLQDNGTDGVPKVGTGTFYTEYGNDGKMVGAFGVTKQ